MRSARYPVVLLVVVLGLPVPARAQDEAPPAERSGQSPFKAIVVTFAKDLSHLPSVDTARVLGAGGALALAVHPVDAKLTREAHASEALDETLDPGATLGGGLVQVGVAVGTLAMGYVVHDSRVQSLGVDLIRAQAINAVITQGVKVAVGRTRPDGDRYSFPSGHSSASFATATVVQRHFGWKFGVPAYGLATYVAASRLQENRHYASDVIFGAAIGIVSARTVTIGHGTARVALSPVVLPGGAGVSVTSIP